MSLTDSISNPPSPHADDAVSGTEGHGRRRMRRRTQVLLALGAATVVAGIVVAIDCGLQRHDRETVAFDDPISAVHVDVSRGSVTILGTDDPAVAVEMRFERGIRSPSHRERVEGGVLEIDSSCPIGMLTPSCGTDYVIRVPRDVDVELDGNGLTADISHIEGSLDVDVNGGNVDAVFDTAPAAVTARANGGDIDIVVPDDHTAYLVDASSNGGSTDVDVRTDPAGDHQLDLHTNGGSISVEYGAGR